MPTTNPGTMPIIEGGLEVVEISMQQNAHKEHLREFKYHKGVRNAIKQLITGVFEDKYLHYLKDTYNVFMKVSIRKIFQHLYGTYGNITCLDLKLNEERIKQPLNQE